MKAFLLLSCALLSEAALLSHLEGIQQCTLNSRSLECRSPAEISQLISALKEEIRHLSYDDVYGRNNCTVCFSDPCLNGGSCVPLTMTQFRCDCLQDYAGKNCEQHLECLPNSCGANAECYIQNHQVNCVCKPGFSGNARTGCTLKVASSCHSGDPHYSTFDGQYFEYMGTCPYVVLEPCRGQPALPTFGNFTIKGKNTVFSYNSHVSSVTEVEFSMYGHSLHVDRTYSAYFDGIRVTMPYYYPDKTNPLLWVTRSGTNINIDSDVHISVVFIVGRLCVQVPDVAELRGPNTLCGLTGNLDGNCLDDFRMRDGYLYTNVTSCRNNYLSFTEAFGDSYITTDFLNLGSSQCMTGLEVTNGSLTCPDLTIPKQQCEPIHEAASGLGAFENCSALGPTVIDNYYGNCYYDLCISHVNVCDIFAEFAAYCQLNVPNTPLQWRTELGCPGLYCPQHSTYNPCAAGCPLTCFDQTINPVCQEPCQEGCECDPGYFLDGNNPATAKCVKVEDCGCVDPDGNYHSATDQWLTNNCGVLNYCVNGTYQSMVKPCSPDASCVVDSTQDYKCQCNKGFVGDGYSCTDIDECMIPRTCDQDHNHGNCTNTPGGYTCTCDVYYNDGDNCDTYLPLRHCADLYIYHNITSNGVYSIKPPYSVRGQPVYAPVDVYCDMSLRDLDGNVGGWTLMTNALSNLMAGKTFVEYEVGFGNTHTQDLWLGLDWIYKMTTATNMSLRVDLGTVRKNRRGNATEAFSYCTYETFSLRDATSQYAVVLNEFMDDWDISCQGSYSHQASKDPWMTWTSIEGPAFYTIDKSPNEDTDYCLSVYNQTGWWFDTDNFCGTANLNGIRYDCEHEPLAGLPEMGDLRWDGQSACEARLLLRPTGYPNYDV